MFYPIDLVERRGVKKQTLSDFFRVSTYNKGTYMQRA